MNIDHLIKMVNEISAFWEGEAREAAPKEVANHLRRFWEPRMRAQIITYYEQRQGAGLSDAAKQAVGLLAAQPKPGDAGATPSGKTASAAGS
jgi:NADH-dependant formate dehydrogenase delta subunit FdsD